MSTKCSKTSIICTRLARHLIHSSETIDTALSVVNTITQEIESGRRGVSGRDSSTCLRELDFITSVIKSLLHRSNALKKRMNNEIALVSSNMDPFSLRKVTT